MASTDTNNVITLFKKLMHVNDVPKIVKELESYTGENSKYFKTLIQNLGDDLSKFKYVFDLVLKVNKESPKVTFHEIYFKYLSTNNFQKFRNFFVFLNKLVLDDDNNVDSLVNEDEDDSENDAYNTIIATLDKETGLKLIKEFLQQRTLNFEEYYIQKYLSKNDKLKSTLENNYSDINQLYYRYPWFSDSIVSKVYISSTDHDIDVFIENPLTPTVYKNKTWYKPNSSWYSFLSNQNNSRTIKGGDGGISTLEFMDEKSKVSFSFHIMYKLFTNDFNFSYLIFNESVYNLEKKFLAVDYDSVCNDYTINLFLDDAKMFTQTNIDSMLEFFNKAMSNVQSRYKMNGSILRGIPCMKSIRTLRELARKISEITIFLHLDSVSESIFKKQIIRNYYKTDVLFDLEIQEKLPELLYDMENVDNITSYLESSIEDEIFNIGESVYRFSRKSMFKAQPRKRTHAPLVKLHYINENDNHNYLYYDKKEKWLNIKDILNKKFDESDEYILDVIYPRVNEIFDKEMVMKEALSKKDFKNKYNLLFSLLEDVMSSDEIFEEHKDLFLYFPDPEYYIKEKEEDGAKTLTEIFLPDPIPVPVVKAVVVKPVPISIPDLDIIETITEVTPPMTPPLTPPTTPPTTPPLTPPITPPNTPPMTPSKSDSFNFDEIEIAKPAPPESPKHNHDPDICSRCNKNSFHECTSTFIHSKSDNKSVKCITLCFECLENHTLSDD